MCKAFSCIVDRKGKVYWKLGIDSHDELIKKFKLDEPIEIKMNKELKEKLEWCKVEVTPTNNNYLKPDSWSLSVDETVTPQWFTDNQDSYKRGCFKAKDEWFKQLSGKLKKILNYEEVENPVHPFKIKAGKVDNKIKQLLKTWASIWDSVGDSIWDSIRASIGDSIWDSVGASVRDSVWDSVGDSVWDSVGDSVWDSVGAYIGSLFKLKRSKWKYMKKIKTKGYPFESCVKLWKLGFVASFDGYIWRLHSGPKAKIVFEITKKELMNK
jgi:hypothetical protein